MHYMSWTPLPHKPGLGVVWSNENECSQGLAGIGIGPTQASVILNLLKGHSPTLFIRENSQFAREKGKWPSLVLAAGVFPTPQFIRRILAPDGLLLIIGSGNSRLDSLKLSFHEWGHIGVEAPFSDEIWWGGASSLTASKTIDGDFPLIASYYTADTPYEEEARRLIASCKGAGIGYYIEKVPNRGSWEANCAYKAAFLLKLWREIHRPLLWVDADGVLIGRPNLLRAASCDFAIHKVDRWEFASGTLFFNATPLAGQLLHRWETLCRFYPHIWDQRLLDAAWEELMRACPLLTWWLPSEYTMIFDHPEAFTAKESPVIVHYQASRRLKTVVSTAVRTSPKPLVCQPWRRARKAARGWLDSKGLPLATRRISNPGYVPFPGTPAEIPMPFIRFGRRLERWLHRHGDCTRCIAIFGASWFGVRIAALFRQRGIEPAIFLDNAVQKAGSTLAGISVQMPEALNAAFDLIVIASIAHSRIIERQLIEAGPSPSPLMLAAHQFRLGHSC
jgi:hypothetical protein